MKLKIYILGILMSSQIMVNAQETDDSQRYDRLFLEAIIEREKGNDAAAFEMLRHCLDIKPEASEAYYYLAHYYLRMKDNDKALAAFKKASLLEPDNVNYLETLAQMYLQSQDLESATETFERLSKAEPDREDVLGMLVQLYSNDKNQYPKAIATLDRMEQLDGMNERISYAKAEFYQKMGNGKAAIAEMKKLADQYPNDLNYRNAYADMLLVNNNEKKAIDIYRGILKEEPANSKVLFSMRTYFLGQGNTVAADSMTVNILTRSNANTDEKIYLLRQEVMDNENDGGDSTKVIQLFERTINAKGSDPSIGLLYASYMELKKMPKADINRVLEDVLEKAPDNAAARLQLIADAWERKDYDRVVTLCSAARQYNPDEMAFYYYQGVALSQQDKTDEALDTFKNGISVINEQSSPDIVSDFYAIMGDLLHEKGDKQQAFAAYDSCLQWKPDNLGCLNNYAYYISESGGNLSKAEEMSYKTIKAEPKNATFLDTYAWILFRQERYAEAKIYIDQTLQCDSDSSAVIVEHAGDIYAKCGDIDKAVELWTEALKKSPDNQLLARKARQRKYIRDNKN
ncbi:MAG: tetratricopeptide repeat protein [Prevotellaceae bacterium]|nr:tetratricopeptide repeat protein [Prevotellaceae bacterium]